MDWMSAALQTESLSSKLRLEAVTSKLVKHFFLDSFVIQFNHIALCTQPKVSLGVFKL